MKIITMVAFSAGAMASIAIVKMLDKPKENTMISDNIKNKIMKMFE